MTAIERILSGVRLPEMYRVRQIFNSAHIEAGEVYEYTKNEILKSGCLKGIPENARVAITAGSRGIANIPEILRAVADCVRTAGAQPFLVPCMGSHGGGDEKNQREVLRELGICEETIHVPIAPGRDVVCIGRALDGRRVYAHRFIAEAGQTIVVNRVKPHTAFSGDVESGLLKMMAVGMGGQPGAQSCHAHGFDGMCSTIKDFSGVVQEQISIPFGLGIIENAYGQTYGCVPVKGEEIGVREPELLRLARSLMPGLGVSRLDVLIVDRMGKDISGAGMDTHVIGRFPTKGMEGTIAIGRIVVLGLTEGSCGNGHGIGFADFTTAACFSQLDFDKTYPNCLTNGVTEPAKIPCVMPDDRTAIKAALHTCRGGGEKEPLLARIGSTREVEWIYASEGLARQLEGNPRFEVSGRANCSFDEQGRISRMDFETVRAEAAFRGV